MDYNFEKLFDVSPKKSNFELLKEVISMEKSKQKRRFNFRTAYIPAVAMCAILATVVFWNPYKDNGVDPANDNSAEVAADISDDDDESDDAPVVVPDTAVVAATKTSKTTTAQEEFVDDNTYTMPSGVDVNVVGTVTDSVIADVIDTEIEVTPAPVVTTVKASEVPADVTTAAKANVTEKATYTAKTTVNTKANVTESPIKATDNQKDMSVTEKATATVATVPATESLYSITQPPREYDKKDIISEKAAIDAAHAAMLYIADDNADFHGERNVEFDKLLKTKSYKTWFVEDYHYANGPAYRVALENDDFDMSLWSCVYIDALTGKTVFSIETYLDRTFADVNPREKFQ